MVGIDPYDDVLETDSFASLVRAARNRALEYEPDAPQRRRSAPSASIIVVAVLVLTLLGAVVVLFMRHG